MYASCKLWYLCAYFPSSLPPSKIRSAEILDAPITRDINARVFSSFSFGSEQRDPPPSPPPHLPRSHPFGSPWDRLVTMATSSSSQRGKEKTGTGSSAQELSRKGAPITAAVVSAENYRPGISTPKHSLQPL